MTFDDELKRVFDSAVAELTAMSSAERDRLKGEAADRGRAEGLKEGREQGRSEGRIEAEEESRTAIDAAVTAVRAETAAEMTALERLAEGVRAIDRARSLSEVLDTLAGCAARDAARTAVLIVRDGKLEGWRFTGFEGIPDEGRRLEIQLEPHSLLAECVRGKQVLRESGASQSLPLFAGAAPAAFCLAAPVTLVGEVVAVLYADQGPQNSNADEEAGRKSWPRVLEVLARHSSRSLEALTAMKAARAMAGRELSLGRRSGTLDEEADTSARRYAKLLVSEIKLYHEAEVAAGRREKNLASRLGGEIARARVLYEQRVPAAVRNRTDYFQDELVRTLADGDATLLHLT